MALERKLLSESYSFFYLLFSHPYLPLPLWSPGVGLSMVVELADYRENNEISLVRQADERNLLLDKSKRTRSILSLFFSRLRLSRGCFVQ